MFEILQISGVSAYNPLVVALILLAAGGAVAATYLYREAQSTLDNRESFAWLLGMLGFFALLVSGELFWANWAGFPAQQYTELFGVAQTLWAATLLSAAFVVYRDLDPRPFAWLTAVAGVLLLQGARAILTFGLTQAPLAAAGIWASAGLAGILLLPAAYVDESSDARRYLVLAAAALVAVMAVLALVTGIGAHYSHIAEAAGGA